ncbi:MAG: hypothetical protein Q8K30_04460 [Candidatus Gracilibacteria bacterium]|nr:hypothetical protein [Candidatus Gracilibacteria bacterium]
MNKLLSIILLIFINVPYLQALDYDFGDLPESDKFVLSFGKSRICKNIVDTDIPTIFIPGILASWYSEESYKDTKIKRWIPDPITHSYDTLFYTFKQNGYSLKDVFYQDQFTTNIVGNPKKSLYLFGYDWKKDNKITAKLLSNLILQIRVKYEIENGCDIATVNIIGHSMGGLVARAMLEDMCASDEELKNYYKIQKNNSQVSMSNNYDGEGLKKISSNKCRNYTRVNKLITISTPHRGSPGSFPMWVKGDMLQSTELLQTFLLQGKLGVNNNNDLYKIIHGYNKKIPNGIVTIGQLLPDVSNENDFNNELLYLNQNGKKIPNTAYPVNSFLEELNKQENIDKMYSNIIKTHTLYYSTLTSNVNDLKLFTKNNIVAYNLKNTYLGQNSNIYTDNTSSYKGKDIYSYFSEIVKSDIYNIDSKVINERGLGGDGTVPSKNLRLVANNTNDGNKIYNGTKSLNPKLENVKIDCYDNDLLMQKGYDLENIENQLTKKIGKQEMELCSHTKMPMLTSVQVFDKISGYGVFVGLNESQKLKKEQELLYSYLGYAYYLSTYLKDNILNSYNNNYYSGKGSLDTGTTPEVVTTVEIGGILNNEKLDSRFLEGVFKNTFEDNKNTQEIANFIKNKNNDSVYRKILSFDGSYGTLDSLIRYEILSPINLIIEDEQGRKIGIDPETGMIINEIPGAWTSGDTEGSGEPEFFLIPKSGTGTIQHKIHSYGTGDGEYHIVMNVIKLDAITSTGGQDETSSFVIAGTAKKGVVENYVSNITANDASYEKTDTEEFEQKIPQKQSIKTGNNSSTSSANAGPVKKLNETKKVELKDKYKDILAKLYNILDTKYTQKKKQKLKQNLIKFKQSKNPKYKDNEKINFLIDSIIEYVK